jgi:hypothetical protein
MSGLRCQAKRGIMTIRPCGEPASLTCSKCQLMICDNHLGNPNSIVCLDCEARKSSSDAPAHPAISDYGSSSWTYGMRNWVLMSAALPNAPGQPDASAQPEAPAFGESDLRSFDHRRDDEAFEPPSSAGGSFLDS